MSAATYYTTLGLVSTAAPEVIRAAYKTLALIYHPDKTLHLHPRERDSYARVFNDVQAAWDVLGSPTRKAAYDAELAHHNNRVDTQRSTFHRSSTGVRSQFSSESQPRTTVKLTTPEEKASSRTKARQTIEQLGENRVQRDKIDAQMADAELRDMAEIWKVLAVENRSDPVMHAHCAIRIHEYQVKIADREHQHRQCLEKMSTAKQSPSTPAIKPRSTALSAPKNPVASSSFASTCSSTTSRSQSTCASSPNTSPRTTSRSTACAAERKRAEAERIEAAVARVQARKLEKAQRDAVKQARLDQKTAAVRAEQEKQRTRVELQSQKDAARIAKARAKAGAAPLGTVGAAVEANFSAPEPTLGRAIFESDQGKAQAHTCAVSESTPNETETIAKEWCGMCSSVHTSFPELRKCSMQTVPE